MGLQVYNPADSDNATAIAPGDARRVAEELVSHCIAEVKQSPDFATVDLEAGCCIAAAMRLVDEASSARRGSQRVRLNDLAAGRELQNAAAEIQKAALFLTFKHAQSQTYQDRMTDRVCESVLASMLRKKLPYSDEEIVQLLKPLAKISFVITGLPIAPILTNAERHIGEHGLHNSVRQQLLRMTNEYNSASTYSVARKAGERIDLLLESPKRANVRLLNLEPSSCGSEIATELIDKNTAFDLNTGEAWTEALLVELGKGSEESRDRWHQLLDHCDTATSSQPTKKFLKRSQELLDSMGAEEFVRVVLPALAAIGKPGECQRSNRYGRIEYGEATEIHGKHVDRLRGIVWTASLVENESLISAIGDAAEKCFQKIREVGPRSPKIGNACLVSLSAIASEWAVAQLGRLKSRAQHASTRKQIGRAFHRAATNAGMTEEDLIEIGVPTFGLSKVGQWQETFGTFTAEVTIHAHQKHKLVWRREDGKTQKTIPAAVKRSFGAELKRFKRRLKDIDTLMPSIRHRIEKLLMGDRTWTPSDFRKRFLDHPLVGVVAGRLIWEIHQQGETTPVVWHDDGWKTRSSKTFQLSDDCRVSIWHPMRSAAAEVLAWRQWLESHQVSQPFKQAHREVYILTDAERTTVDHSNRFASHIIRQHQFAAMCQQRGWRFELQGDWDSWNAPYLDLPQYGLQVAFYVDPMEDRNQVTEALVYTHLATESLQFFPVCSGQPDLENPIPLATIDPIVFSEVMRDVDLFVGVTSIGNDPEWREREADGEHTDYWEQFSFGELSQTALTRKQVLQQILPRLEIADHCHLSGRFLMVQGKLREYKIHLGTSNILMAPNDRYLCIVQKRGGGNKRTDTICLPFEGDNTLALILSKAFLLVKDDQIKDLTIANQIRADLA